MPKNNRPAKKKAKAAKTEAAATRAALAMEKVLAPKEKTADQSKAERLDSAENSGEKKASGGAKKNLVAAENMALSEAERELILRLRNDDKDAEKFRARDAVVQKKNEEPSPAEKAWASVFDPVDTLNEVHAHCAGIVELRPAELREEVKLALAQAETWKKPDKLAVQAAIKRALPSLVKVLLGKKNLPLPEEFSAERTCEAYITILEKI